MREDRASQTELLFRSGAESSRAGRGTPERFVRMLEQASRPIVAEIQRIIASHRFHPLLAQRLLEYPLRAGKGLRPALCLYSCEASGGRFEDALHSAVSLELFHNAFLVHDDVEDQSTHRRGQPTMLQKWGVAIAVNVGDALNVLTIAPLLANLSVIGLDRALRIFREIERMARESVEGQAIELDWVWTNNWRVSERNYFEMTRKKTCWYTCIAPCRIGAIAAGEQMVTANDFTAFALCLGIAFQIQDDLLNLVGEQERYGKESAGDLWEGKRTLMLIHLLRSASRRDRNRILNILSKPRERKSQLQVDDILHMMARHGSIEYGKTIARNYALRAERAFARRLDRLPESEYKLFLQSAIRYVIERDL